MPRQEFTEALELDLFGEPRAVHRRRPLVAAGALAGGLAAVLLGLSVAGSGPLGPAGDTSVDAKQHCRYVTVKKVVRVPRVVETAHGHTQIVTRRHTVSRRVKRCT